MKIKLVSEFKYPTLSEIKKKTDIIENEFAKIFIIDLGFDKRIKVVDKIKGEDMAGFKNTYSITGAGYNLAKSHFEVIVRKYKNKEN